MAGPSAPTATDPSGVRGCRLGRQRQRGRPCAPAASDKLAPKRSARRPGARQRPLPNAENFGGEVSFRTSLSLHITRSPRRRGRAVWAVSTPGAGTTNWTFAAAAFGHDDTRKPPELCFRTILQTYKSYK